MNAIFANFDWLIIYKERDVNVALNIFYEVLLDTIEQTVPKNKSRIFNYSKWFSKELCFFIKEKNGYINYLNRPVTMHTMLTSLKLGKNVNYYLNHVIRNT